MTEYTITGKKEKNQPCTLEITGKGDVGQQVDITIFARSCDDVKIDMDSEIPGSMLLNLDANEFMQKTTEFFRICGCLTPRQATTIRKTLDQEMHRRIGEKVISSHYMK